MPHSRVVIVGAGLSGLVCARILQLHGVPVTIFELDTSAAARQQGGSLDIHTDTGQRALKEAGLYEEFLDHVHAGGEAMRLLDKTGHVFIDQKESDGGNGRPEIDRKVLRQLFVDSLEPGTIIWGSKVVAVRQSDEGNTVEFADGSTVPADLIIGADGAWSKVRAALTDIRPVYTGITMVEIRLTEATKNHPKALALVGQGSLFALSDNKYIGGHGGDDMALGVGLRTPENWVTNSGIDWDDPIAIRAALVDHFDDWATSLTNLIRECDDTIWPRPIYALPIGHTWQHASGVTLVGDAAHLMSPFAGEGANLAMIDGADLARAILATDDLDAAVKDYESTMFRRGAKSATASDRGLTMMFNSTAPRKMVAVFGGILLLTRLAAPLLRVVRHPTVREKQNHTR